MGLATLPQVRRHLPSCWLPLSHAEAVTSHPGLELVGLCDPFTEPRQQAAALYPQLPIHAEPEQLLQELRPDLVCIATRTPERPALIELCLEHGVRRLHLEKPLCTSAAELRRLTDLLRASGAHCTFGALRRYLAPYRQAQALLQAGRIGALQEVQVALGPGRLCWSQIHAIDLIAACLAPAAITEVRALADPTSFIAEGPVLDGDPLIRFARFATAQGPQGLISCSGGCDLWLHGEAGLLGVLNDGQELLLRQPPAPGDPYWTAQQPQAVPAAPHSGTAAALDRLVNADAASAAADTEALLRSQALLLACVQSILAGAAPVDPDRLDPDLRITGRSGSLYA
jgi:predicted dehydrogenase